MAEASEIERLQPPRLVALVGERELDDLRARAAAELADPAHWGTTFTLIQTWARTPA